VIDLRRRSGAPELMDSESTDIAIFNDLRRHALAYGIARVAPGLLRMNRLVRHDASLSVARAFERQDWERLLAAAGLADAPTTIVACFPFRFALGRIKPA
jgi:hypothetical protein